MCCPEVRSLEECLCSSRVHIAPHRPQLFFDGPVLANTQVQLSQTLEFLLPLGGHVLGGIEPQVLGQDRFTHLTQFLMFTASPIYFIR